MFLSHCNYYDYFVQVELNTLSIPVIALMECLCVCIVCADTHIFSIYTYPQCRYRLHVMACLTYKEACHTSYIKPQNDIINED